MKRCPLFLCLYIWTMRVLEWINFQRFPIKKLFYYKTGNGTVDSIQYIKQKMAENSGIVLIINDEIPENCKIASEHFASIIGNLLDNALEASADEEASFIEVKIKQVEKLLVISISDKCTRKDIFLETTKTNKNLHAIGFNSVKHTVRRYNGDFSVILSTIAN